MPQFTLKRHLFIFVHSFLFVSSFSFVNRNVPAHSFFFILLLRNSVSRDFTLSPGLIIFGRDEGDLSIETQD
jgi:hypothetical protein